LIASVFRASQWRSAFLFAVIYYFISFVRHCERQRSNPVFVYLTFLNSALSFWIASALPPRNGASFYLLLFTL
jgi:hypothetical protein